MRLGNKLTTSVIIQANYFVSSNNMRIDVKSLPELLLKRSTNAFLISQAVGINTLTFLYVYVCQWEL